ncbi:HNH endonuclease [Rhodovulum sp. DZ06]|uniref:HNH endonuclease n=1 Tax=Rhodovulum sp. DZ06 TaxID=3425126 RepID=UPI003D3279E9
MHDRTGQEIPWEDFKAEAARGNRISSQAKGIYKPGNSEFALSVKLSPDGPYDDKHFRRLPDGSWTLEYHQEGHDYENPRSDYTNAGLFRCMEEGVPVGVLVKTRSKPEVVHYRIEGLALVEDWKAGYFKLRGATPDGRFTKGVSAAQALRDKLENESGSPGLNAPGMFEADNIEDLRERELRRLHVRRGQARFRQGLLEAYQGRCAVTGTRVSAVLEAAHIMPYRGAATNHVQNGLLLRSDIHALFDQGLLAIDAEALTVVVSSELAGSAYDKIAGKKLRLPAAPEHQPSKDALAKHRQWAGI